MSTFAGFVQLALRNLRGYPLRSLLTTLGVVFGIASVVTMLAMGRGAGTTGVADFLRKAK